MNIAIRKVELINWLSTLQDESMIKQLESLKKSNSRSNYEVRMGESIEAKLGHSETDIEEGRVQSQDSVEAYFASKSK